MKTPLTKLMALLLVCALALSMTGCDALDYRDAIDLYNEGAYAQAAEIFKALGDFEDSAQMYNQSRYWLAHDLMEQGEYETALALFQTLGGIEDSRDRITECSYQMAVAHMASEDWDAAEALFLEAPDYRQSGEYLRQIAWQRLFDAVAAAETPLQTQQEDRVFSVSAKDRQLVLAVSQTTEAELFYSDTLTLTLDRDSTLAAFAGTSIFHMDFTQGQIGSTQTASGRMEITTCTLNTALTVESYEKTVTDNLGNTTTSEDFSESRMEEAMAENFQALMAAVPQLLADAGIRLTLADIGFEAL